MLVALLLDLDEFKRVNDLHGHAAGDLALQHVATLLRDHCRAGEPVFRLGGEEFFALLQSAGREAAERAAERILQALRDDALRLPDKAHAHPACKRGNGRGRRQGTHGCCHRPRR